MDIDTLVYVDNNLISYLLERNIAFSLYKLYNAHSKHDFS